MQFINYGESALLVNFEQVIDLDVNQKVIELSHSLEESRPFGYNYSIPAYCSLTIVFDPLSTSHQEIKDHILSIDLSSNQLTNEKRSLIIPVCYESDMGIDLLEMSALLNLSIEEIISIHTSRQYHIYMMGFLPGFSYMGTLNKKIETTRKAKPRLKVAERSIAVAGLQTGIYPIESPGGWNIIGRTPIPIFDADQDDPILFGLGDKVIFKSITSEEYQDIELQIKTETFDPQNLIYVD